MEGPAFVHPTLDPCKPRSSYTAEFKLHALKYAEENGNSEAQKHFSISEANLRDWKKKKSVIEGMPMTKKANRYGQSPNSKLEEDLYTWICRSRLDGNILKRAEIIQKAKDMATQPEYKGEHKCSFSNGWYTRFIERKVNQFDTIIPDITGILTTFCCALHINTFGHVSNS